MITTYSESTPILWVQTTNLFRPGNYVLLSVLSMNVLIFDPHCPPRKSTDRSKKPPFQFLPWTTTLHHNQQSRTNLPASTVWNSRRAKHKVWLAKIVECSGMRSRACMWRLDAHTTRMQRLRSTYAQKSGHRNATNVKKTILHKKHVPAFLASAVVLPLPLGMSDLQPKLIQK